MAISRAQLVKELEPGLNALFGLEYKQYENQSAEIYVTESSDRAFEEEVMLSGFALSIASRASSDSPPPASERAHRFGSFLQRLSRQRPLPVRGGAYERAGDYVHKPSVKSPRLAKR